MPDHLNFVDLFAGGGGLSEGFMREGYQPVAHVEGDAAACNTLRTRMAYHWLVAAGKDDLYEDYPIDYRAQCNLPSKASERSRQNGLQVAGSR